MWVASTECYMYILKSEKLLAKNSSSFVMFHMDVFLTRSLWQKDDIFHRFVN